MASKEYPTDEQGRLICWHCKRPIPDGTAVDHGYRKGDTEEVVEIWACRRCDEEIYDEAVGYLP